MKLKSDRKKINEDEIQKKNYRKKKITIKRIMTKLERLKNNRRVKLKIICNVRDYL
jgi:hypothetical protein